MIESGTIRNIDSPVSRICFGAWQASDWATSNEKSFFESVRAALSLGINFFDTAEIYGNGISESLLGKALQGKRDRVIVATKFSHRNSRPAEIRRALEASLKRLKTDYVDLYQQHWPPLAPPLDESIAELSKLRSEGKIRAIGVSNWMGPEFGECSLTSDIDCVQNCCSLLWRSIEREVLPLCISNNIAVIAYSPLCQGLLAGRFKSAEEIPQDFRKKNILLSKERFEKSYAVAQAAAALAPKYDKPVSAVALRFLLDTPGITSVIVGASSASQVEDNIQALGWALDKDDYESLASLTIEYKTVFPDHSSLWGWHSRAKT